jgi:hypothetical protein
LDVIAAPGQLKRSALSLMNRIYWSMVLIVSMTAACSVQDRDAMQFSRPTVKGTLLTHVPKWHQEIYHDEYYKFVFRHYGNADYPPGFFVYDIVRNRWLEVTDLSTEHAVLGRSPDFSDVPLQVGPDFRALARSDYARLPLRTSGSIVFPDKIVFSSAAGLYRLACTPELNREVPLTSFWVRKVDLDELR